MKLTKLTRFGTVAIGLTMLLAACTQASDPTTPGTGSDPAQPGEPANPSAIITVAGQYPVMSLDPHGTDGAAAATLMTSRSLFSRLTKPAADGKLEGDLAEKWEASDDGKQWTFTLKDGVKFADDSPITAEDVAASLERMRNGQSPLAGSFADVEISGEGAEVVVSAPAADPALPGKLSLLYVVPKDSPDVGDGTNLTASGPYVVDSFTSGEQVRFKPNENYWGEQARNGGVHIQNIPEVSTRLTALQTGEVDMTWGIPDDQVEALRSSGSLVVETIPSTLVYSMWFNSSTPALQSAEVRNAIWRAVDFQSIIENLYPESGELAKSPLPPSAFGYAAQTPPTYDKEGAIADLKAAGFDFDGTPLRLHFAGPQFRSFLQAVVSDLTAAGIPVELLEKEQAIFTEDLLALKWDINFQQLGNPTYDAAMNLGRLYKCEANRNGYCNPDLDELLTAAGSSTDSAAREQAYADATKIIWDDAVGMYPMLVKLIYAWSDDLDGVVPDPSTYPDFSVIAKKS